MFFSSIAHQMREKAEGRVKEKSRSQHPLE